MDKNFSADVDNWQPIYQEFMELVGAENTLKIYHQFRGTTVNFPMHLIEHSVLVSAVKKDFEKGYAIRELGRRYDLAERTVQKYLQL